MGKRLALIFLLAFTLLEMGVNQSFAATTPDTGPRWDSLSPEIKGILTPVAPDWDQMPAFQRKRLANAAKHYPQLSPDEQARFRERLPEWAKLPHEQRKEARETYKKFHDLPKEKREVLKKRWQEEKGGASEEKPTPTLLPSHTPLPAR
jgi:Protein of unknown function (DUF3106)